MRYESFRAKRAAYEKTRQMNILDVANSLGMDMKKMTSKEYEWTEHDALKINPAWNHFTYWSQTGTDGKPLHGGPIQLVQEIQHVSFSEAVAFLTGQDIKEFEYVPVERKDFEYKFKEHEYTDLTVEYLTKERGISEATVRELLERGIIAQTNYTTDYEKHKSEPVVVFKSIDAKGVIKGVSLQGIWANEEYGERKHLKRSLGDGNQGMILKVGNPNLTKATPEKPYTVIVFEAPIDMLSYYDLFKSKLHDVVMVAMNGKKPVVISNVLADAINPNAAQDLKERALEIVDKNMQPDIFKIVFAVDNDIHGIEFIEKINIKNIPVARHLPKMLPGQEKTDWNDMLKHVRAKNKNKANSFETRLNEAKAAKTEAVQPDKVATKSM
ncbi:hypothetical protein WOSG25_090380 [Weissella oryzae SG25]|uniref:DUF3991 domain-containing protein n=1 Tax=Weissella oryzae (strain DSM 25784 / JCM 18191 / LMG 30913 / SG25) TaxID=1329250 RepID=A0A069D1W3_WEIOS|nr:toprim domain-containing protein [Weissella oryzae]GAK31341.1 hypothetical protein WOSG25_090380 [Weissella oryzae SG25]